MNSPAAIEPLLRTVDRMLTQEGIDPAKVSDEDKLAIATQYVCVACDIERVERRVHIELKEIA